ncbi:MAG TPA: IS110 family transposase [Bryobacteraceae bacterium]|nr:IS110 family transposase [Bryobacteraceae bacterium]
MIPAVIERGAGIDVGKKFVVACVMTGPANGDARWATRKFGTTRQEVEGLRKWLQAEGCTHVVMESTGVYWKPILNVLEDDPQYSLTVLLANPQQVKAVTGHKTDPHDARWLAHLLRHGMIRPSFIPPRALRDLRDFTRRRKQMIGAAAEERNRVQKILEDANVKIGDVLSDVFGLSGQLMLEALVNGLTDNAQPSAWDIAQLARGHARKKLDALTAALEGHQMRTSHRTLIRHAMRHMAFLAEQIEALDQDIAQLIHEANLSGAYELLQTIPGIRAQAAATILAESGPDMKQFPTAANFSSWSGLAPGNNESAGKRKRARAMKGNPHIKTAVVEAAWSASRTKQSEFEDRYQRRKSNLGHKRALVATAHTLAIRIYEVLSSGAPYQRPGEPLTPRAIKRLVRHHTRRLKCLHHWLVQERPR